MATTTALDIINGALRPLSVLTGQTSLSPSEAQDALQALNWMIGSWAGFPDTVYKITRETFDMVPNKQVHTWGNSPEADWKSERPNFIRKASATVQGVDYPVDVISYDDYEAIKLKKLSTAWPAYLYNDNDYPLAGIYLWPVPPGGVINIMSSKELSAFDSLYEEVVLPTGYEDAMRFNLAIRLAPEYMVQPPPEVVALAQSTLKNVKRQNKKPPTMTMDPLLAGQRSGGYNVFSDGQR